MSSKLEVGTSRSRRKAATRDRLIRAAALCFEKDGFVEAQVAEIAERAEVAYGTFYVHFPNKEAVLDELLASFNRSLVGKLDRLWADWNGADPLEFTRRLAVTCLNHWRRERGLVRAFVQRAGVDGDLAALRDGINPPVATHLTERLRDSLPIADKLNVELMVQAILGMWTRVAMQYLFGENVTRSEAAELLARLSVGAVTGAFNGPQQEDQS